MRALLRQTSFFIGETVCLPEAFPRDGNAFILSNRKTIVRPYLRQPLLNLCNRGKRKPEHIGGTKRGALVPRRQPSPRSVVFRRRPENKVFRLVARQNPFTEGVLAAPPSSLKVKATDTALIFPMKSQYRLPIKSFGGLGLRPYLCAGRCLTCVTETREKGWRNRVHTNVGALCAVERANAVKAPTVS